MPIEIEGVRCTAPDQANATVCRWPFLDPTWTVQATVPGVTIKELEEIIAACMKAWSDVCGIKPRKYRKSDPAPNLVVTSAPIDGPSRVLADCQLPCGGAGPESRLRMRFDNSEAGWAPSDLFGVGRHETGHWLGLGHLKSGNVMQPTYSRQFERLQADDTREAVFRYDRAIVTPTPPVPAGLPDILVINGRTYRGD